MTIKELAGKLPYLCDSKNAERESEIIKFQFNDEINNENSTFHKNEIDLKKPFNRLKTVIFTGKLKKVLHCKNICKFVLLNHYKIKHNEKQWNFKLFILKAKLFIGEIINPSIKKEVSIKELKTISEWDG
ncbi:MAG: hypothetical protein WC554_13325 [Clostridia bacterium]